MVEQPKPKPETKPVPVPKPVDKTAEARKKAQNSGLLKFQDELADLRQNVDLTPLGQTKNLQGAVGQDSHAERSLIASKAGGGLGRHHHRQCQPRLRHRRRLADRPRHHRGEFAHRRRRRRAAASSKGGSGKPSRSQEEIALVFDRNKGAIYALYGRALRDMPDLQGKLVLEFTIAPSGEVTECHVVSSELKNPELERKIVARVKLFRFEAKDVATITTTKPIEFVPTTLSVD